MSERKGIFSGYIFRQFRKNKPALISVYVFGFLIVVAFLSDLIANNQPLYARYRGRNFFPAFETIFSRYKVDSTLNPVTHTYERLQYDITDWRQLPLEKAIWAPIPYSANQSDKYNLGYVSPGDPQHYKDYQGNMVSSPYILRHHMGTNRIGQDVASGLIHGTGIALKVGLLSMTIAAILGVLLGTISGFFGDFSIRVSLGAFLLGLTGIIPAVFYGFVLRADALKDAMATNIFVSIIQLILSLVIVVGVVFIFGAIGSLLGKIRFFSKKVFLPIDILITKLMELLDSIPTLILIITVGALFVDKSLGLMIAIIGFLFVPQITRLTRAEFIRIRNLDYIQSAKALGIGNFRIVFRHILPNALSPVLVALAFGAASAIIAESGLSFLGIGVRPDVVTWGSILSYARDDFSAWWMVVFPGIAIFVTVTMFNLIGEGLRQALNPRSRQ